MPVTPGLAPGQILSDGILQSGVGVGDDQGRAAQAPGHQAPQEGAPASAVLAGHHVEAEDLGGTSSRRARDVSSNLAVRFALPDQSPSIF